MLISKNMNSLVFTPKYFYYCEGNVGNMAVTRKRPHHQRANVCHFISFIIFYNVVSEKYSVQNSPCGGGGGGGRGSMACPRSICLLIHFLLILQ